MATVRRNHPKSKALVGKSVDWSRWECGAIRRTFDSLAGSCRRRGRLWLYYSKIHNLHCHHHLYISPGTCIAWFAVVHIAAVAVELLVVATTVVRIVPVCSRIVLVK